MKHLPTCAVRWIALRMTDPFARDSHFRVLLFWLACFLAVQATLAAEAKRAFNIPAEAAEKSLKQFASQSGVEVLFSTQAATGIRTNAIRGEFAPTDAVRQMLAGTPLYLVNDDKNGVLRIARSSSGTRADAGQSSGPSTETDEPQKKKR